MTLTNQTKSVRCAAVDIGASSGRVMIAELSNGQLSLTEAHRFETPLRSTTSIGYDHWDIDTIVDEIRNGIEKANALAPLDSVGCDTWGVDFVLLDAAHEKVGPVVAYRDHRTIGMMDFIGAQMPKEEVYHRTGIHFQPYNTLYQLAAVHQREPQWLERARHILFVPDYLHFKLSGVLANEYTIATTSQMLNVETQDWDPALLALIGVQANMLLKPTQPGTVLGAMHLKSNAQIKVILPGSHDTASAVAAAPLTGPDDIFLSSGTWSLMGVESERPYTGGDALAINVGNEGGVCGRYRVLKNVMGLWLFQRLRKELGSPDFSQMVAAAAAEPAWRILIDPDDPRFLNPTSMCCAIQEVAAECGEPIPEGLGALTRCVIDSLALKYRQVKEELEALRGRPSNAIRIIGGGSQNALLNQLTADACQLPVSAGPIEASALGNVSVQMIALGAIKDLQEARALVRASFQVKTFQPQQTFDPSVWQRFLKNQARV